jgi:hypothetical protein
MEVGKKQLRIENRNQKLEKGEEKGPTLFPKNVPGRKKRA